MSSISYTEIFENFLGAVTDYNFVEMDTDVLKALMLEYMKKVFSYPYVRRLFKSLSFDDTAESLTYELDNSIDSASDDSFVVGFTVKGMVVEWIEPQVKKTSLMAQMFGGKELKWFSQAS